MRHLSRASSGASSTGKSVARSSSLASICSSSTFPPTECCMDPHPSFAPFPTSAEHRFPTASVNHSFGRSAGARPPSPSGNHFPFPSGDNSFRSLERPTLERSNLAHSFPVYHLTLMEEEEEEDHPLSSESPVPSGSDCLHSWGASEWGLSESDGDGDGEGERMQSGDASAGLHLEETAGLGEVYASLYAQNLRWLEKVLAEHGACVDLNACLSGQRPPLLLAAILRGSEFVARLVAAGAAVDLRDERDGRSALWLASETGNLRGVARLLALGADLELRDKRGAGALLAAAQAGHRDVVALLLERGAEVDARDNRGRTALVMACAVGHTQVMSVLLEAGADPNAQTLRRGLTPLMQVVRSGYRDALELLLQHPLDLCVREHTHGHTALMMLVDASPHLAHMLPPLLARHQPADLDVRDLRGRTALMHAAMRETATAAAALLETGAACNVQDGDGRTALHFAAERGCLRLVMMLLSRGADPNKQDARGYTPLMLSLENDQLLSSYRILQGLVDPLPASPSGRSALVIAAERRHRFVFLELLRRSIPLDSRIFQKTKELLLS